MKRDNRWRRKSGFRIVQPKRVPQLWLRRQLEGLTSASAVAGMIGDVLDHSAVCYRIVRLNRLSDRHPDRHVGQTEYTHTVIVRYRQSGRPGVWECVYGVTSTGEIHLWMD